MTTNETIILRNCNLVDTSLQGSFEVTPRAAIILTDGKISWQGNDALIPRNTSLLTTEVDCDSRWATPGLIDCHTHLVYGGSRVQDFALRMEGRSYQDIALGGGGILSTVAATRAATEDALYEAARRRLRQMAAWGATTVEVKSGYGLNLDQEAKILTVAKRLRGQFGIDIKATYLGAHCLPPEFEGDREGYLSSLVNDLATLASLDLVDAVDGFCDTIAFSQNELTSLYKTARSMGLAIKGHVEQLTNSHGTQLLASVGALSADHLEHASESDVSAMKGAGTVAVLLPGAYYFLRETRRPPVQELRDAGVDIAIATDHNPGTSPLLSLPLAMNMAVILFGLSPAEALRATTINAAKALGLKDRGKIAVGARADLCIWEIDHPVELSYHLGYNPLWKRLSMGSEYEF